MDNFNEIRKQLDESRKNQSADYKAILQSREQLKKLKKERAQVERKTTANNNDYLEELNGIKRREQSEQATLNKYKEAYAGSKAVLNEVYTNFERLSDPRKQISNLKDAYPCLLFPIRIETRFKKLTIRERTIDQLWIRIFPDDCLIDSFEEMLSATEVSNTQFYWAQIWEAGGIEAQERAAWRSLAASHGSGRAAYLIEQYAPVNPNEKPVEANGEEVVLVVTASEIPTPPEQVILDNYWKKQWLHQGNKSEEDLAWNQLVSDAGSIIMATDLLKKFKPFNLDAVPVGPKTKDAVTVRLAFLQLPDSATIITKEQSWSQAPLVDLLPERFVVTAYSADAVAFEEIGNHIPSPLYVAPDPGLKEEEQFTKNANGEIVYPEELQWMIDFDVAIKNGLGMKVNITPAQAKEGFDRIVVLGIRLSADEQKGTELLETLFDHHRKSRKGISIIPQGTPTNNTEFDEAGHQSLDDADKSFDLLRTGALFKYESNWLEKKDGQWLAESLGIDYSAVDKIPNSNLNDMAEARMMNVALWPATFGYMMETMMQPVFEDTDVTNTRNFFNQFVAGRGHVPAIKIGKQPYGILTTTAFSKLKWIKDNDQTRLGSFQNTSSYLTRLYSILSQIDADWTPLLADVAYIGKAGDAHKILLDVLGLNPSSIEFYQRTAQSKEDLYNRNNLIGNAIPYNTIINRGDYIKTGQQLLKRYGYTEEEIPDILNKFFLASQNQLKGPLIDDRPLSETVPIRKYTADGKNYIDWLINAAQTSHNTLRRQQGFVDDKTPSAMLYLMLHHALDLSYVEVSLRLFEQASLLTTAQVKSAKIEPAFLHIQQKTVQSESRWNRLYSKEASITGNVDQLIGDFIPSIINTEVASRYMKEQLEALEKLKNSSTAKLERMFTEHIDCCTYRLDAWKAGIMQYQLSQMRQNIRDNQGESKKGIHLGAFGWIENVRSENKVLSPVEITDPSLKEYFLDNQSMSLQKDNKNGGFLMAPSLDHAITASILRNGYTSNQNPEALRINLSSERVRKALSVIEGIRGGQQLGALLGYYFERGLHESYPGLELDYFIYQLRKAFPLVMNRIKDTMVEEPADPADSVEVIEARNVIDGLSLIDHITASGSITYPFGKNLPALDTAEQATAINKEVEKIKDINDAIADLALAESVHQVVQGNYDRANATLDTFSKGNFPPIPEVIQTPRSGLNLTHRVGLQFKANLPFNAAHTPRANAEPGINDWLQERLPSPADLICNVSYSAVIDEVISAEMLGLLPIDILYVINMDSEQSLAEIDDRVLKYVIETHGLRPDVEVSIDYMKQVEHKYSFFELAPLLNSLRGILLRSRPLLPTDVILSDDATNAVDNDVYADNSLTRLRLIHGTLSDSLNTLTTYVNTAEPLVADTVVNHDALLLALEDEFIGPLLTLLFDLSKTGLPQTGFGFIFRKKKELYNGLLNKASDLVSDLDKRLLKFDAALTAYDALPITTPDTERMNLLQQAELYISTVVRPVLPALPNNYITLLQASRSAFVVNKDAFAAVSTTTVTSLKQLLDLIKLALPIDNFVTEVFDLLVIEEQLILFAVELATKAKLLVADLTMRLSKSGELLDQAPTITENKKLVDLANQVTKYLFHEDFKIVPEFGLTAVNADQWNSAYQNKTQLLDHLINTATVDFPEDDWLYGVARVREKMHHWENIVLLSRAFKTAAPEFHPVQLPHKADDSWLALEYPESYVISSDRLLYTAHYATPFDKTIRQCGLLLDEWTEIVPAKDETVGLAFHYDRPNAEPPQTMLLAMPTDFTGEWNWQDLMDTVNETLDMAKKRAIEPAQIDETSYARFLPALVSSMTVHPLTASLNFAFNNKLHEFLLKK